MNVFLQRTVIEIKTDILDLRTSNYGIICTEKCKNKISFRKAVIVHQTFGLTFCYLEVLEIKQKTKEI